MKPFIQALGDLNKNDDISVYWTENMMYVNDESDSQSASTITTLFDAYRFALFINAPIFDYTASDKEVKEFQAQLLNFCKNLDCLEEKYYIDVWQYLDDIAEDFKKLTGKTINDIDYKRAIVAYMSSTSEDECGMGFGSATYIARLLEDNILGNEYNNATGCNNKQAIDLANKYLNTDEYDLNKFAEELHKATEYEIPKDFNHFMDIAYGITETCYFMGTSLLAENKEFDLKFIVGEINWQGDWIKPIYCCMNSTTKDIWFEANGVRSAFIYDMIIPHYMCGCDFDEIEVKLTNKNLIALVEQYELTQDGVIDGYIHCNMYGTQAKLQSFV